ncbi:MAG TPA: IS66 family transposase [Candidatus Marinimicrobia bacterium]|jgi:transposase|nr:IS66 family transposase [Candidatus Neomarinimicrobiota bacterium]
MSANQERITIPLELEAEMTPAVRAFVAMLLARIEELETRLGMNPQNSSLPPSSEHPHSKKQKPKRKPSGRKRGGQTGHTKHQRTLVPSEHVTETITLKPSHCRRCGGTLRGVDPEPHRHQVFELPEIKPIITEYQQHRLSCPCCGVATTAQLPDGVPQGQTGPRLVAFTALLMACFRQSKRRTALFLETVCNIPCSAGLTVKHQNIATKALRGCYEQMRQALPRSDAVAMDETPAKEANRKAWLWTAVTKRFTLFHIADTRAADVAKDLLGKDFSGIVTSDRYGGYDWIRRQQLCWAHLLRDFQSLIDVGGKAKAIGRQLKECAQRLFHHWHRYRDGTITRRTMRRNIRKLWWPVFEALEAGTLKLCGKQAGMCQHILDRVDHLWTFLKHGDVEPTNNASERSLRHAVIWRKLSFGTQSASGSRFVETMLSVIETCRQQNRDVFTYVTEAIQAHFNGTPTPKLLFGV